MAIEHTLEAPAPPSPPNDRVTGLRRFRRKLQIALGVIWVAVGGLQYQPYMFKKSFLGGLENGTAGQAQWIKSSVHWAFSDIAMHHLTLYNAIWASIQLVIGLLILYRPTVKIGLAASIPWALLVWWFGEGFGGLWGGATPVMGYPGAVMIYALIALLVWPRDEQRDAAADSVATAGLLGSSGARLVWTLFWLGAARFQLLTANRSPTALGSMVTSMRSGEPQWIKDIDDNLGSNVLNHHGTQFSLAIAILFVFAAVAIYIPKVFRSAVVITTVLALFIWVVENFGVIFTSEGTDPNSGPLLILLAVCYWPVRRSLQPSNVQTEAVDSAPH
jgi:hypothetical protein